MTGDVPQTVQCYKPWSTATTCAVRFNRRIPPNSYVCVAQTKDGQVVSVENREWGILLHTEKPERKGFEFVCVGYQS